jgi:AraC family transcriptional regulator
MPGYASTGSAAMNMLRDTDTSVVSIAAAPGYACKTAFAAPFGN